ncbi:MAG: serine--tRNA ligase [Candidatus Levybacteria bacterium CG_4_10_14_0_2_um_filter_35_8]|nr:MAG: serine--tRNA ligase [Candidatus Levybacteria bacterium CG_4_10_14_0_2_um_filter_35_8]PJC54323.1 MAG: serine--tRNA ligase [Candidatus Levybacteria bacterium CG_4_9_14_0_2_um_filter_35_21]
MYAIYYKLAKYLIKDMLEIDLLQNKPFMHREMSRRFARDEYDAFIDSYEKLSRKGIINPQKLTDVARTTTLENLQDGIQQQDSVLTLVDKYLRLPNVAAPEVPTGENRKGDVVVFTTDKLNIEPGKKTQTYIDLGIKLGIFNPEQNLNVTAEGFPFLFGAGASLDRALVNLMLDTHAKNGYQEIMAPTLVNERSLFTTGAFPLYGDKSFHIEGTDLYLNPTIEVQQTNLLKNARFGNKLESPLRLVGYSRSFRIEDEPMTLYTRLHEFGKTEIFVASRDEDWRKEHERALESVEEVLKSLELPYRKVLLCTGSMGLSYHLTYDYEVFAPGSDEWWEVASCSSHSDYSSRYMDATYQDHNGITNYVHTLHVTSVSLPRILSAVLENYQLENGNIQIPTALSPYMRNSREISPSTQPDLKPDL